MEILNIPESYLFSKNQNSELFVYDFKMTEDAINSKVNLTLNMFSFLQTGAKKVQFEDNVVEVNNKQSVLIKAGNCLMTELLNNDEIYFCKLFFFSNKNITDFLEKHQYLLVANTKDKTETPFFVIENDDFIDSFVASISSILNLKSEARATLLAVKFEEIMLYLSHKYSETFVNYIQALGSTEKNASFRKIVEANINSNLSLTDIAFLANMSLSTFKRYFEKEYQSNPGKWLQKKRLNQAKILLEKGEKKPTEIFSDFGYTNFSNFSIAYKNEFGFSPKYSHSNE
jgi:AraC-like DNA-binding protein